MTYLHGVTTDHGRGGRAGINKNVTYLHGVTTDQGRGGREGINKNVTYLHGVTTHLLDVLNLFCIFQIILLPNIMFYQIITTLDGEGGQGRNNQKRHTRGVKTDLGGGAGQE